MLNQQIQSFIIYIPNKKEKGENRKLSIPPKKRKKKRLKNQEHVLVTRMNIHSPNSTQIILNLRIQTPFYRTLSCHFKYYQINFKFYTHYFYFIINIYKPFCHAHSLYIYYTYRQRKFGEQMEVDQGGLLYEGIEEINEVQMKQVILRVALRRYQQRGILLVKLWRLQQLLEPRSDNIRLGRDWIGRFVVVLKP
eukprot:TRINITY_DN11791_c0_g2_i4.p1 TRINITY_DN11791_c0_g2~~TRINITY_DN11791_c0_g2_i4.p1  ORF type:complete len:194 (+),score=1.70 TRINITY_DN11791_c0_g2_i4:163-744(+)